jgi:TolB-like protein/Tfp pilus assembly protein PilF
MFTDIVGYTALMGRDEDKAFQILRKNRGIHRPIIKKYRGEWLKEMGDGILASFKSSSDAVRCANEIQYYARKEGISLRIGIHEGEVVFEESDVLGDGVNVASRLEEIAEEGCINISGAVYKDIRNKAGITAEFIEEKMLKNVEEPVKVYKVSGKDPEEKTEVKGQQSIKSKIVYFLFFGVIIIIAAIAIWQFKQKQSPQLVIEKEKSIAVRPFWNESVDPENEPFVNGVTEDIRNNLARITDLRVISRGSMEKYRDTELSTTDIARELNVSYVLEGTAQRFGNQVKIHAQLIDAVIDDHIWQDTYEIDLSDMTVIFKIQSQIAQTIAEELFASITPEQLDIIEAIPTTNLTAYDFFMRARDEHFKFWFRPSSNRFDSVAMIALEKAITLYYRALEYDSTFAQAYSGLAMAYWNKYGRVYGYQDKYDSVMVLVDIAFSYDDQLEEAYLLRGCYLGQIKGDYNGAMNDFEKAIQINPNYAWAYQWKGNYYTSNNNYKRQDFVEGIKNYHKAMSLDHSLMLTLYIRGLAEAYWAIGFVDKADYYYQEAIKLDGDTTWQYLSLLYQMEYLTGDLKTRLEKIKKGYADDSTNLQHIMGLVKINNILGNTDEAYNYTLKLIELDDSNRFVDRFATDQIGYAFWQAGKKEESKHYFNKVIKRNERLIKSNNPLARNKTAHYNLAKVYVFLGDKEKAYQYLDEFDKRNFFTEREIDQAKNEPLFNSIREEERFQKILLNMEVKYQKEHVRVKAWLEENDML